jgi:hypothetical protein
MAATSNAVSRERRPGWAALAVAMVACGCSTKGTEVYPNGRPIEGGGGEGGATTPVPGATGDGSGGADSSAGGGDSSGGGTATASGGSSPSAACAETPPASPPSSVSVGGTQRTFLAEIPVGYDPNTSMPIVLGFHGTGTDASSTRAALLDSRYGGASTRVGTIGRRSPRRRCTTSSRASEQANVWPGAIAAAAVRAGWYALAHAVRTGGGDGAGSGSRGLQRRSGDHPPAGGR